MKDRIRRVAAVLAAVLTAVVALAIVSFAIPIPEWRTGELPAPPLPVVEGGPAVHMPNRIWIDTDAACGHSRTTDPDDCFALLLLIRAQDLKVAGISTVHGNASIEITDRTTRELVAILEREDASVAQVHRGSGRASDEVASDVPAPAHAALRQALEKGPLTIVALGPLTNIATALEGRPDLQRQVARLVVVMGRRSGHLFHPSEGAGGGMLFGHGPVFTDLNFDQDRNAARLVLAMKLPMTLVPYEAAREVVLTGADLTYLEAHGGAAAWVASRARGWLAFWEDDVGKNGFYPFDVLAGVYALQPSLLSCGETKAWVSRDERLWSWVYGREALLVGVDRERPSEVKAVGSVLYCPRIDSRLHTWMMPRLTDAPLAPATANVSR